MTKLRTGARLSTIKKSFGKLEEVKGNCYFCHKEVNGEFYCFGCHKFVCGDCEASQSYDRPSGSHSIEDHRQ